MRILVAMCVVLLGGSVAEAQMLGLEVRGGVAAGASGGAGPLIDPLAGTPSAEIGALAIWRPPLNPLFLLGSPGAEAGVTATLGGQSLVHAGLSWQASLPLLPVYAEAGFGAAALAGGTGSGCGVLAYGRAGLGANLGDGFTLTLGAEHADDFGLCGGSGRQATSVGAQLGVKF
jgi:hypothetical protein